MKRQFIAGAKCPKCGTLDRVVKIITVDDEWIECITCEYTEKRPTHVESAEPEHPDEIGVIQFKPRQPE
ncbi:MULTISPECIES: YheV family putative metal-binding protein [Acinetobacter]|uniref:YheV family putative metal-binding protein n=1 Tax=Acinetobacter sp. PK01 TaxID=2930198 RepID=UPI001FB6572A|nr:MULTISPECIES: YheV family putative metal-binding protein [Acinetobacter]UOG17963.1 YheV family putative metal-binding protein [Acinetobacter sp. PK01]